MATSAKPKRKGLWSRLFDRERAPQEYCTCPRCGNRDLFLLAMDLAFKHRAYERFVEFRAVTGIEGPMTELECSECGHQWAVPQ